MAKKTIEMIVEKQLKRHRTEVILLWLIIAVGAFLIPTGIALYFNVGKLPITQYVSAITSKNVMITQVRMVWDLSRGLGIVYSLSGISVTVLALNRLSLAKSAYRMATFIRKEETKQGEPRIRPNNRDKSKEERD